MSNRTLIEINHDCVPFGPDGLLKWAMGISCYVRTGDVSELPGGVTFKHRRHHSESCPIEESKK